MNAEQRQRASQLVRSQTEEEAIGEAFALLQELIDAPEPEPVSDCHVYVHVSGLTGSGKSAVAGEIEIAMRAIGLDVEWVDSKSEKRLTHADYTSALELYRPKVRIFEKNIPRTAPPAPSVPDSKTLQFLTDVLTAAGLLRHGKKDAGLATRIADESCRIRQQLFTQPEQPADVAQDAERYRAIRGGIVDIRDCGNTVAVEYKSVVRYCRSDEDFDQEIDAAIAAEKGGA